MSTALASRFIPLLTNEKASNTSSRRSSYTEDLQLASGGTAILTYRVGEAGPIHPTQIRIDPTIKIVRGVSWLAQANRKLESLRCLVAGWDSYHAEPPNESAIFAARRILETLAVVDLPPTRVLASAEGGVTVAFFQRDRYADIECLNTGEILAVQSTGRTRPQVWMVTIDRLRPTVDQIREFLAA